MRKLFFVSLIILVSCNNSNKQEAETNSIGKIELDAENTCNYSGTLDITSAYSFKSDNEAEAALNKIMKSTGLPTNFALVAADVDNAAAVIHDHKRYILYNQKFMDEVRKKTKSEFGALSILAHEIGHHLSGHTLLVKEARPELELEADRFSGFILAKMGATMEDACIAIDTYGSIKGSSTHPARRSRIAAIVNGWKEEKENYPAVKVTSVNRSNTQFVISVPQKAQYITIRNRSLSPEEFKLANSGKPEGDVINKETVITNLPIGTLVEILSNVNNTYYVKANFNGAEIYGYIIKSYAGKPTIRPQV